jgi:hypothetical protein
MEAAKVQNWAVEPQEKKIVIILCYKVRISLSFTLCVHLDLYIV